MKYTFGLVAIGLATACTSASVQDQSPQISSPIFAETSVSGNVLSGEEVQDGFTLLWDGQSFSGWRFVDGTPAAADRWRVEGDSLNSIKSEREREKDAQSLFTDKSYASFELVFDFNAQEGANSGVKYLITPGQKSALEYQLVKPEDGAEASNRGLGSLFDIAEPSLSSDQAFGALVREGWNTGKIVVRGAAVEHWLNGEKIVSLNRCSAAFQSQVANSLFKDEKGFGQQASGKIMLQYNDGGVAFRNVKLKSFAASNPDHSICEAG